MAYVVLARKYRPRKFEEVAGQEAVATTLKNAIQSEHVAHAYLFAGPRGVGKTSMARILAAALNCKDGPTTDPCGKCQSCQDVFAGEDVDVLEIDGASNTGVENIRDLRSNAAYVAAHSRFKIYIIDEVHMLSTQAFNALLKTLEEPPGHVKFIFATTEPHKVIETVQSRCQRFDFRNISTPDIVKRLEQICKAEGVQAEERALWMVAHRARGGMRDSQSLLDQLIAYDAREVSVASVEKVLGRSLVEKTFELLDIIGRRDPAAALGLVERLSASGESVVDFLGQFQEGLRNLMLLVAADADELLREIPPDEVKRLRTFKDKFTLQSVIYMITVVSEATRRMRTATEQQMLAELAVVKLATMEEMSTLTEILARLEALESDTSAPRPAAAPARRPTAPPPASTPAPARTPAAVSASKPADAPEPATERPTQSAGGASSKVWQEVIARLKEAGKRRSAAFAGEGIALGLDNGQLTIGFPKAFKFHREHFEETEVRKEVETLATEVLGQPVRLKVVESAGDTTRERAEEAEEAHEERPPASKPTHKTAETASVRKATELFRGRVIDRE